jgi:transcriptional regulator with XRE-family HTH domain
MQNRPYLLLMSNVGQNIRKYRKALGLTQIDLAKKLGLTQALITNYERGLHNPPTAKLPDIAKALNVPLEALYGINSKDALAEKKGSGTRREAQIQKIFRELPAAKQRAVLEHAKGLKKGKA